jgi:hypothetical protein
MTPKRFIAAVLVVAAVSIITAPALASPYEYQWLSVDSFSTRLNGLGSTTANLTMSGSFNTPLDSIPPADTTLTLSIDEWSVVITPELWTNKGAGKPWVAKTVAGDVTVTINYWVKGSSRCKYTISAKKQPLPAQTPNMPDVPITLMFRYGLVTLFNQTVVAECETTKTTARLAYMGPSPSLITKKLQIKDVPAAGKDSIVCTGRFNMTFDPDLDSMVFGGMGILATIDAGVDVWKGSYPNFSITKTFNGTSKLFYKINADSGKFLLKLTGLDVTMANPTVFNIDITGPDAVGWPRYFTLTVNTSGTVYSW